MIYSSVLRFAELIIDTLPSTGAFKTRKASPFFLNAISGKNSSASLEIFKLPKLALNPKLDRALTASLGPTYWCEISTASLTAAPLFLMPYALKTSITAEISDFSNLILPSMGISSIAGDFVSGEVASILTG